ncbi:MAG: helix-turn-helix transcriptional regulator [Clostridia bacterium]|nr:helix-turn-helix transcriptional regulator [Clostridia bacterium]MBQ3464061.1 helix-turn-helix transcriptional regulator [Clostridia bacterium]
MTLNYALIGRRIKAARKRVGLTQAMLAEVVDKSTSHISYIETGKKQLSLETLVDIANALHVTADFILADNQQYMRGGAEEFASVLDGCSATEVKIIIDTVIALRESLKEAESRRLSDNYIQ